VEVEVRGEGEGNTVLSPGDARAKARARRAGIINDRDGASLASKKENRRGRRRGRRGGPFRWERFALKFGFGTRARIGGRAEAPRVNPRGSVFSPEFIDLVEWTNAGEIQQRIWKTIRRLVTRHTESAR